LVYITDTLVPLLDEGTLVIGNGGTYDHETRTVTWDVGIVPAHASGSVTMEVAVRADAPAGAAIGNQASIYFPTASQPRTDTNIVLNHVLDVPPVADITFSPEAPTTLDVVTFEANASDADGFVAGIDWDFNDGSTDSGAVVLHQFTEDGTYHVVCTTTDDLGVSASYVAVVGVGSVRPSCAITYTPINPASGDVITFQSGAFDPEGAIALVDWDLGDGSVGSGVDTTHTYQAPGTYQVCVTVTDEAGLWARCCEWITVGVREELCLTLQGDCWHMITLPCYPVDPDPWMMFDELRPPLNGWDALSGNLTRYNRDPDQYVTYWATNPVEFGPITPGEGYWLWLFEDATICYQAVYTGLPEYVHFPYIGWYLTGSPQPYDCYIDTTLWYLGGVGPFPFSVIMNQWVQDPFIGYHCLPLPSGYDTMGLQPIDEDDHLRAFQGYWMYAFEPDLTMEVPPGP
jgi:PKD repeat protein